MRLRDSALRTDFPYFLQLGESSEGIRNRNVGMLDIRIRIEYIRDWFVGLSQTFALTNFLPRGFDGISLRSVFAKFLPMSCAQQTRPFLQQNKFLKRSNLLDLWVKTETKMSWRSEFMVSKFGLKEIHWFYH